MLPIITIGLTDAGKDAVERISKGREVAHFADAEEAAWRLVDGDEGLLSELDRAADGRWHAHAVYGDLAFGPILTSPNPYKSATPLVVPVTGVVALVTDTLGADQFEARRVVEGQPEERSIRKSAVEVLQLLGAQHLIVIDQLDAAGAWATSTQGVLARYDSMAKEVRPPEDPNAAATALAEQRRANLMLKRGQVRQHGEGLSS